MQIQSIIQDLEEIANVTPLIDYSVPSWDRVPTYTARIPMVITEYMRHLDAIKGDLGSINWFPLHSSIRDGELCVYNLSKYHAQYLNDKYSSRQAA